MGERKHNAADARTKQRMDALDNKRERQIMNVYRHVLGNEMGRQFVVEMLADCEYLTVVHLGVSDQELREHNGRRRIGAVIVERMNRIDPALFLKMLTEKTAREMTAASEREAVLIDAENSAKETEDQ